MSQTTSEAFSALRKSQRETLKNFTDAATEALAKKIVDFEREGKRQQELHEAKFSARMSELGYRLESVADLERRLNERLATLKDARVGLTIEDVEPVLRDMVSEAMAKRPRSVSIDDIRPVIAEQVAEAVARLRHEHHQASAYRPQRSGWPHNLPIIDIDPTPDPLVERVTAAVKQLRAPLPAEATS